MIVAKLYYGNGVCTIESSENIKGVEIRYTGNVSVDGVNNETRLTMHQNNRILILSMGEKSLDKLFAYTGTIKISNLLVSDNNANKVSTTIHRVMDYAELLTSNAEDMTEIKVENMNEGHIHGKKRGVDLPQIMHNLHTSRHNGTLYLAGGMEYNGDFHVHLATGGAMTGKTHSGQSQLLYTKRSWNGKILNVLVPTNDIKSAFKRPKKRGRRVIKRKQKVRY